MKTLQKGIKKTPTEVLYLQFCQWSGLPISVSIYYETIEKYPEYFSEEHKFKKKWEAIPQEVHDARKKEYLEFLQKLWENEPKSPGIIAYINKTEESIKYSEAYDRLRPIEKAKEEELDEKYYSKYLK